MTTSMWICAHLPLHGTFRGKLLIWLNLSCKGTHVAALKIVTYLSSTFLRWFFDWPFLRLCHLLHKTNHSFLARCNGSTKGRSPKRKFQSREELFRGAAVSPLPIGSGFYVEILAEKFISSQVSSQVFHKPERAHSVLCRCPTAFDPLAATLRLRARIAASKTSPGRRFDFSTSQCDGIGRYFWVALCFVWMM